MVNNKTNGFGTHSFSVMTALNWEPKRIKTKLKKKEMVKEKREKKRNA